ncbi:MAG TPA: hypothetical protein VGQ59_06600 [Cyclobacteriaceae bacterium]|jgi:stalled ribosome rescue protein Dom34|nr:hypothetical protein [Cyclobacteriaceae bacterium]
MTVEKKLGIWMDHSNARVMEFAVGTMKTKIVSSDFTNQDKENSLERSESNMHNREQHQMAEYYKKLGELIRHYQNIILFGPTKAKVELYNLLRADSLFSKIKIKVQQADKMTDNQQYAFVRRYFNKSRK